MPLTTFAQENDNPIHPYSTELMNMINDGYIATVNLKRKELGLSPLVEKDSLDKLALQLLELVTGITEGESPTYNKDHRFTGIAISPSDSIVAADIIKAHWRSGDDGRFPGIKPHYTKVGIASILRKQDLINYVIFE